MGWWWRAATAASVIVGLCACSLLEPAHQEVPMQVADILYDEPVENLDDLRATSDSVVLARPLPGEEIVLLDVDGVQVLGRRFEIVRGLRGPLATGEKIVVARPRYGVSPEAEQRLNARGYTATAPPDSESDSPPFDRPLYLLGLDSTGDDYPTPAWTPANGPHSRVAFDTADIGAAKAEVEVDDIPLQDLLAGTAAATIIRRLDRR